MRIVLLITETGDEEVPLIETGELLYSALDGTTVVVEETGEIAVYQANRWNIVGYADRVNNCRYKERKD